MINPLTLKSTLIASAAAFALGASGASYTAYKLHGWRVDALQSAWATERVEIAANATHAAQKQCDELNAQSEAISNALKTDMDAINARYHRLLKSKPVIARCMPLAATPSGDNGTTNANVPVVRGGVTAEWLTGAGYANDKQAAILIRSQQLLCTIYKNCPDK